MNSIFDQLTGLDAGEYTPEMALALIEVGPVAVWNALEIAHANGEAQFSEMVSRSATAEHVNVLQRRHCVVRMATDRGEDDDVR